MLIKLVYEVDPFICPKCNGTMKVVSFITEVDVVRKILLNDGLWTERAVRPPPSTAPPKEPLPQAEDFGDFIPDYTVCEESEPED